MRIVSVLIFDRRHSYLLREYDEKATEHGGHIEEQVQRMLDAVGVAIASFLHDGLGVIQNEGGHHDQTNVQVCLELGQGKWIIKFVEIAII